jgi:hypothetical protein
LTNFQRGEKVTIFGCLNAAGTCVTPMIIFKGIRKSPHFKDGLPLETVVGMSDSGCIDEDLLMDLLRHFLKFKSEARSC